MSSNEQCRCWGITAVGLRAGDLCFLSVEMYEASIEAVTNVLKAKHSAVRKAAESKEAQSKIDAEERAAGT